MGSEDSVKIGPEKFRRDVKTAYRIRRKVGKKERVEPVTLDAIVFLWQHRTLKPAEYVTLCVKQGIKNVPVVDRVTLLAYMKGDIKELPEANIDRSLMRLHERRLPKGEVSKYKDPKSWTTNDILAQERHVDDSDFLKISNKEFSFILDVFANAQRQPPQQILAQLEKQAVAEQERKLRKRQKRNKIVMELGIQSSQVPIIVVPSAMTSLITMYNAESFLGGGLFRTSTEMRSKNPVKQEKVVIMRQSYLNPEKNCPFEIIDNVKHVASADWPRVVAVFVNGARWQFTGWPWGGVPANIFDKVLGFHMYFEDEQINKTILTWKVKLMPINKLKRYRDRGIVLQFWRRVGIRLSVITGGIGQAKLNF